jgi:hypothetical protein
MTSTTETASSRRAVILLVAGLIGLRVVSIVVLLRSGIEKPETILGGDARRYLEILDSSGTPYRDFAVEYPPLTLALAALIRQSTLLATIVTLAISQLILEIGTAATLWWAWGRRSGIAYLVLGTPMVLFPFPWVRIDFLSVFLVVLAFALMRKGRPLGAGLAFAASIFAKAWPVALLPAVLVRRQWRTALTIAVSGTAGLVAWVWWAGTDGLEQISSFRGANGWQIESLPGIFFHIADPGSSRVEQGAWRTGVDMSGSARALLLVGTVAVVACSWRWASQSTKRLRDIALDSWAPLACTLALLVFAPIISPQYILWIMPFAALAAAQGDRVIGWLALSISALTTFLIASIHAQTSGANWATYPVVVRNALLVVTGIVVLRRLWCSRATSSV